MAQRFTVNGFRQGLDKRRSELTSAVGSLQVLNNCHVNNGAEIEKRRAFFPIVDQWFLRTGQTYGLNAESGGFVAFGSGATPTMATVTTDNTGMGYQLIATTNYLGSTITAIPFSVNTNTWVQTKLTDAQNRVITITNNSTSASGTVSFLLNVTSGGSTNGTATPLVVFTGTWAVGDIVSLSCIMTGGPTTVLTFTVAAMPASSFTTTNIAAQLAAALRVTWPQGTGVGVSVSANVITITSAGMNVTSAGTVSAAGTLTIVGSGGVGVTVTVGGTWLTSDLASLGMLRGDNRFSAVVVKYGTDGFTAFPLSAGAGTTPPIVYQRLNPPTLGLTSPTLSAIIESCTFADESFVITTFSDGYNYLYYDGAVIPDSFVGYVYSYMVNATAATTRANILKQFGYGNAGSLLSIDPGVATADTLTFYQANGPGTISSIVVSSFSTSTGKAVANGTNTVLLSGQWAAGDWISITVVDSLANSFQYGYGNVTALQNPVYCFPYKNKVYVLDNTNGGLLDGSKVGDATIFNDPSQTGTVQIGLGQNSYQTDTLVTASPYQGYYAIFFRNSVQIWSLNDNPTLNTLVQVIQGTGCVAKRGAVAVGQLDVLYLSDSGVRSLRVRDSSNNAFVVDIGSPIDNDIVPLMRSFITAPGVTAVNAVCGFEPTENRFIISFQDSNFVVHMWALSYYPEVKVTAWATYDYQCFIRADGVASTNLVEKFITWKGGLYARGGFNIGGISVDGLTVYDPSLILRTSYVNGFDASQCSGETPWWDAKHMELVKDSEAIDVVMKGWWQVEAGFDPLGSSATQIVVPYSTTQPTPDTATDSTFGKGCFSIRLRGTHIKMKFYTKLGYTGAAKFAAMTSLYQIEDQK